MALPADRTIPEAKFPEKYRRFVAADAPAQLRLMCARGLVPMPPVVQISALFQLAQTGDDEVRRAAEETLRGLPRNVVVGVAREPVLPVVLDWLAERFTDADEVLEAVVLNPQTDDETVARVARRASERVTETIAVNQQRLLRATAIIEALYYNPNTRASTADRVVDFAARNGLDLSHLPGFEEVLAAIRGESARTTSAEEAAKADAAFKQAHEAITRLIRSDEDDERLAAEFIEDDESDADDESNERRSAAGRIRDLTVPQKVRLALLGSKTERAILIKDSNKVVSRAVINSPALTDQEVISFSGDKNLPEEILGTIAKRKQWTRHYKVRMNLAQNPRCPLPFALTFLKQLRINDVRTIARSKNVPGAIAKAARELVKQRI